MGGTKKIIIKEEVIPTTLVEEELNPFDSLINMIDKEFYKLEENLGEMEKVWKNQIEREVRRKASEDEKKLKALIN